MDKAELLKAIEKTSYSKHVKVTEPDNKKQIFLAMKDDYDNLILKIRLIPDKDNNFSHIKDILDFMSKFIRRPGIM